MKRVNAITFLNNFVSGALTLLVPLLLLEKHVTLAEIGAVLSILPLVFMVARLFLAAVADRIGWNHIFLLINLPATVFSTLIYYFAAALPEFIAGKVLEGLRDSSYWAVSRTAIFHLSPKKEANEATKTNAIIWLANAVGSAAAGTAIFYIGFYLTILLLAAAAAALLVPSGLLWKIGELRPKLNFKNTLNALNPKGKPRIFWLVSIALMLNAFGIYPLVTLLLPAFMSEKLGYTYFSIGILFMAYNLTSAAVTWLALKTPLNIQRALIPSTIYLAATFTLAFSGLLFPALVLALAFGRGFTIAFFEHMVAKVSISSKNISVDIGWLHVPMRIAEFLSILLAGLLTQLLGYEPVFAAIGILFAVFVLLSYRILKLTENVGQ